MELDPNLSLDSQYAYDTYASATAPPIIQQSVFEGSSVTIVTTINGGGGGQATGPTVTFGSNWSGVNFIASAGNVNIEITNAANARTALGAAASGANADINTFSALTGNTGVNPWTGTPNGATQSTYPTTVASVGYVQAEMQGLMDKMQDATEFMMFLVAALLATGVAET